MTAPRYRCSTCGNLTRFDVTTSRRLRSFHHYTVGGELRAALAAVPTLEVLRELLDQLDHTAPYPGPDAEGPRGRAGSPKRPALPDGWLTSRELDADHKAMIAAAELDVSGG